ncbi:MAG TPA: hypothetical protein VJO33_17090 [Gemmatimonadaceae bacterium]|nr:hypothetical protein [Gemmatimonadaceae bacterium]
MSSKELNAVRDAAIVQRYTQEGARIVHLARDYNLSTARVKQILTIQGAARPDFALASRYQHFFTQIDRSHLKAVYQARECGARGEVLDVGVRWKLRELHAALDRALDAEEQ